MATIATPEAVDKACRAIVARGDKLTNENVKQEIGGGSLSTISPLVNDWRRSQEKQRTGDELAILNPLPDELTQALEEVGLTMRSAMAAVRRQCAVEAQAIFEAERHASQVRIEELKAHLEDSRKESEALAKEGRDLEDRLILYEKKLAQVTSQAEDVQARERARAEEAVMLKERLEQTAERAARAEESAAREAKDRQAQTDLATMARAEVAALQSQNADLREDLTGARQALDDAKALADTLTVDVGRLSAELSARLDETNHLRLLLDQADSKLQTEVAEKSKCEEMALAQREEIHTVRTANDALLNSSAEQHEFVASVLQSSETLKSIADGLQQENILLRKENRDLLKLAKPKTTSKKNISKT